MRTEKIKKSTEMVVVYCFKQRKDGKRQTKAFAQKRCGCLLDTSKTYEVTFSDEEPVEGKVFEVPAGTNLPIYDPREL
jgi:hypothetical protein